MNFLSIDDISYRKSIIDNTIIQIFDLLDFFLYEYDKSYIDKICRMSLTYNLSEYHNVDLTIYVYHYVRKEVLCNIDKYSNNIKNDLLINLVFNSKIIDMSVLNELDWILSKFNRKLFNYWINRYYFFLQKTVNVKYEKHIERLFLSKRAYNARIIKSEVTNSNDYIWWLTELPPHYLSQINNTGIIYGELKNTWLRHQVESGSLILRIMPILIIFIIIFFIILYFKYCG